MFQIFLGALLLIFGIFLKVTKERSLATSKRYWWMFILLGVLAIVGTLLIQYQKGEL